MKVKPRLSSTNESGLRCLWCGASPASGRRETLGEELQGRGEVPHLDGSIVVTGQDEPPGSGAHPAAAVTLVNTETGDDGPVN